MSGSHRKGKLLVFSTIEECIDAAKTCETVREFQNKFVTCHKHCLKMGWWPEVRSYLYSPKTIKGFYTKEKCIELAKNCKSISEFVEKYRPARDSCIRNGYWLEIRELLTPVKQSKGFWTLENCIEKAKECSDLNEFKEKYSAGYRMAYEQNWLDFLNLEKTVRKKGYWNYERCKEAARTCRSRNEFWKKSKGAATLSNNNGWMVEFFGEPAGNIMNRCVYEIHFSNKVVYIGLSYNSTNRLRQHLFQKGAVYEYIQKTGEEPSPIKIVSEGYIHYTDAQNLEDDLIKAYKAKGYNVLNKVDGGSLGGGHKKWNKEKIHKAALKFSNRKDFIAKGKGAYNAASREGILDEVCSHMVSVIKSKNLIGLQKINNITCQGTQ